MDIQALKKRWHTLVDPFCDEGLAEETFRALAVKYAEDHRYYHTLEHIGACLKALDQVADQLDCPAHCELALWFHDAIYDPKGSDNEALSAEYARQFMIKTLLEPRAIAAIEQMIMLTQHSSHPQSNDECYVVDADLTILGASPELFGHYEQWIRQEYDFVPELQYRKARKSVLNKFLQKDAIYQTPYFHERYEAAARMNLLKTIASLSLT